jgi:hypothetical protein
MSNDPVLDFLEELETVVRHLRENWSPAPRAQDQEYGWEAVARRDKFNREQEAKRERDIREHALEIIKERHRELRGENAK